MADAERMIERYTHGLALQEQQLRETVICKMLLVNATSKELWHPVLDDQLATTNLKLDKSMELKPIMVEIKLVSLVPLNYKCTICNPESEL